jgi:hypothetical protein
VELRTKIVDGNMNGRDNVGGEGVYGKLILFAFKKLIARLDWKFVFVDRVEWRDIVYVVRNYQFL